MKAPAIVTRDEWLTARKELLEEEKAFMQQRDALSAKRRRLPWVKIEKNYTFDGPHGERTLAELFGNKSQLIVQHFMLGEDWEKGCPSCSFWADGYNGMTVHIGHRDAAFVAVSNAPYPQIDSYRRRMGWTFDWVSSHGSSFNYDYHVSFTKEQLESGSTAYNYGNSFSGEEAPGISIFAKDDAKSVYHTYSCYARGLDNMNAAYQYIDLLPKGRDEDKLPFSMGWVRRHNEYED